MRLAGAAFVALLSIGCTVGEGQGSITSERLFIDGCWDGPFDLKPDFFGANPFRDEALQIRIQRGDNIQEMSDGLTISVTNLKDVRARVGEAIPVGLPSEVEVVGARDTLPSEPVDVTLALYLHSSCHTEIGTVYSLSGSITFTSLFSGDLNESEADQRLTEGSFQATFADPRQLGSDDAASVTSEVVGEFSFFFQRGQPAQPFQ